MTRIEMNRREMQVVKGGECRMSVRYFWHRSNGTGMGNAGPLYPKHLEFIKTPMHPGRLIGLQVGERTDRRVGAPGVLTVMTTLATEVNHDSLHTYNRGQVESLQFVSFDDYNVHGAVELYVSVLAGYAVLAWQADAMTDNPASLRCAAMSLTTLEWELLPTKHHVEGINDNHTVLFGTATSALEVAVDYLGGAKAIQVRVRPNEGALAVPLCEEEMGHVQVH